MNSINQQFIIKFVNRSEFDVLHDILKDLTAYITVQQMQGLDYDTSADPTITSEVAQHHLSESDMRETDAEIASYLPTAPVCTGVAGGITAGVAGGASGVAGSVSGTRHSFYDDEIPLSSDTYSLHNRSPSVMPPHPLASHQPSPQPSPREPVQRSVSAQGVWQQAREQLRNTSFCDDALCRSTSIPDDHRPSRDGSLSVASSARPYRRSVSQPRRRPSSLADTEDEPQRLLREATTLNRSQKSVESGLSADSSTQPLLPNPGAPFSSMADPLLQTPKSLLDAGASSSSHPTPRLPLSTHYPGGLSAATTNREIPFSNQVVGSFLNRYYGMYSIEMFGQKIYFVVMENLLPQGTVSEVYDLKVGVFGVRVVSRFVGLLDPPRAARAALRPDSDVQALYVVVPVRDGRVVPAVAVFQTRALADEEGQFVPVADYGGQGGEPADLEPAARGRGVSVPARLDGLLGADRRDERDGGDEG